MLGSISQTNEPLREIENGGRHLVNTYQKNWRLFQTLLSLWLQKGFKFSPFSK